MRYISILFLCIGCTTYDTDVELERDGFAEYYPEDFVQADEEVERSPDAVPTKKRRRRK